MLIILFSVAFFYATQPISSHGKIGSVNVALFWDANLTMPITGNSTIDWGLVEPGSQNNLSIWVYNPGTLPANISVVTSDWLPLGAIVNATDYIWLDWIMPIPTAPVLPVSNSSEFILELNVDASIHDIFEFSFQITVVGSWQPPG